MSPFRGLVPIESPNLNATLGSVAAAFAAALTLPRLDSPGSAKRPSPGLCCAARLRARAFRDFLRLG